MFGKVGSSRQKAAKAQISLFETALDTYRLDTSQYPTTSQGLEALRTQPSGVERWDGPYLPKDVPKDPWGHPYEYRCPGEHGDFDIISYGADGSPGGEDENMDIVSWRDIQE
jgi:general secretion pathway protein G